jgi:cell division protease FtsH
MLQYLKNLQKRKNEKKQNTQDGLNDNEKNLRFMMISASVLIGLFIYTLIKSDSVMLNGSYMIGIGFLFFLMILSFYLNKYKEQVRAMIPSNKFQEEMDKVTQKSDKSYEDGDKEVVLNGKIEPINSNIKFDDIAGIETIKEELEEIVDFLHNPKKYTFYGATLPKGVLLVGPPGVGKTLIARAVAGEADVPFFYQSGASFVHIYVGMGAKRVKELFDKAKSMAPSIIFIDEIDAVGKSRNSGSNDEREATLNELLTQMDGFDGQNGVIVIAATNKIEVLDEALLRAGRFDRRVFLSLPSLSDREKILKLYTKNKKLNFNIQKLANDTSGFSSAALATLINEAILNMIKRGDSLLNEDDIGIAKQKVQYGKKQINILSDVKKDVLATYQASKSFITRKKVSLFDDGIGEDVFEYPSKSELLQQIKNNLAGSVGVFVMKNEQFVVFPNELDKAKELANDMVLKYDMGSDAKEILETIKEELMTKFNENKDELIRLKMMMLKDEVIVF